MENRSDISLTRQTTIFLTGKQLSEVLDVAAPTLSEAARNGYYCGGEPVAEWAVFSDSGRVKGYEVPEYLASSNTHQKREEKVNPKPKPSNKVRISPNEPKEHPNKGTNGIPEDVQAIIDQYINEQLASVDAQKSWLPPNQNYAEPVGMASLASVLKKALETNTPESRMLIFGAMTGFGSLIGHTVNDNGWGAVLGGLSSAGLMYVAYQWLRQLQNNPNQPNLATEGYKRMQINRNFNNNQSDFTNN